MPSFLNGKEDFIWNYKNAMLPKQLPKRLGIIGSGAIGIEFASFYNDLGSEVSVFEMQDRICPNEDHDISVTLEKILTTDKKSATAILGVIKISIFKRIFFIFFWSNIFLRIN